MNANASTAMQMVGDTAPKSLTTLHFRCAAADGAAHSSSFAMPQPELTNYSSSSTLAVLS
jgi:hypothetical protein